MSVRDSWKQTQIVATVGSATIRLRIALEQKGAYVVDFLFRNKLTGNVAIIEIKTPNTRFLPTTRSLRKFVPCWVSYRADIVCQETATERVIVIENQLERTDHDHLGKLLTYAAGLKAEIVVWVETPLPGMNRPVDPAASICAAKRI